MNATANDEARAVLDFWFGDARPRVSREEWFRKDDAFDRRIAERFTPLIERALQDKLQWSDDPTATLARIVVLDQFTRNVFRNTARSFAGDAMALAAARQLVALGHDQSLDVLERLFVYLPFEHAENLQLQDESVRLFTQLEVEGGEKTKNLTDYAQKHREIVARFGRFPHRNAILGRESTAEETEFLKQPGSSF